MMAQFSCQPGMDSTLYPDLHNTWWVRGSQEEVRAKFEFDQDQEAGEQV